MKGKKKILLVSNGFYPEISPRSYRATELAKEFTRQGHAVTVISKYRDNNYSEYLKEYPLTFKMWSKAKLPRVPHFKRNFLNHLSRRISRLISLLFEYPAVEEMFHVKKALKHENGYDLLISFAVPYPVHWGVAWAWSKKHRIAGVWVADCGDPYMGDVLDRFKHPFYFKYFERWFCKKADFISIPIKSAMSGYYPEFHYKIRIIPQGFNFSLNVKDKKQQLYNIPKFAYAGSFLQGIRDPGLLMQFLVKINMPFKFYVFTDQMETLNGYIESLNEKLILSGFIERTDLMDKLSEMDFLINFDNNTRLNVPSKLIDYAIVGRPVLNIDKDFRMENLLDFLNGDYSNRMELPDAGNYHIAKVSKQFLSLF